MAISTWKDYKEWISNIIKSRKSYYFRGQRDATWKLQTSLHREIENKNLPITLEYYNNNILPVVNYYISAWRDEIINLQDPQLFASFLSLLQHHGFPTPLLDWTMSPYIAAYFAFKDIDDSDPQCDNIKIFIFDYLDWEASFVPIYDIKDQRQFVTSLIPYAKFNPRLIHQRGACTVTNTSDTGAYILKRSKEIGKNFLYEFVLSVKEKRDVMLELDLMGINQMSLFSGIDGICRTMKDWFISKDQIGPTPAEKARFREALSLLLKGAK